MSWVDCRSRLTGNGCRVEAEISALWHEYLVETLGIPPAQALLRIEAEVRGQLYTGLLDRLELHGWVFGDATVLDVGCGTGALACALVDRGARFIGVESSPAWAAAAQRRLQTRGASGGQVIIADGARIPLADRSVDLALSLQVLEHVPMSVAKQIMYEIARVLRPGGRAYVAFENYCSFKEPHYRVRWLPYLSKSIGAVYLRLRGRNPHFLLKHIYYNSALGLAKTCMDVGLSRKPRLDLIAKFRDPALVVRYPQRQVARLLRLLPSNLRDTLAIAYVERSKSFVVTFCLELTRG